MEFVMEKFLDFFFESGKVTCTTFCFYQEKLKILQKLK